MMSKPKPRVQVHNVNGILVAEFWECLRLDPDPVKDLRMKYEAHLGVKGRPELVIDLLGVEFAGSAALGHFVGLHKSAKARGGRLIFCNVDPMVRDSFRLTKLEAMFSFVTDRAAALALAEEPPSASPANGIPPSTKGNSSKNSLGIGLRLATRRRKLSEGET